MFIDAVITVLEALLNGVDILLVFVWNLSRNLVSSTPPQPNRPRVVIIGASFSGLATEHGLDKSILDVTVIDFKEYFEYVPGSLRCFIEPEHFEKALSCDLQECRTTKSTTVVKGLVTKVLEKSVQLKNGQSIPFDFLVLAAGSTYFSPVKPTTQHITSSQRQEHWNEAARQLEQASTILIVGAGAVGVELAGEILTKYPNSQKRVVLVDMAKQILTGFHPRSVSYVTKWLEQHGAELRLGERIQELTDTSVTFSNGLRLQCDIVYKCVGAAPNTDFLKGSILEGS